MTFLKATNGERRILINLEEILYLKSEDPLYGDGTIIYFRGGVSQLVSESLEEIEAALLKIIGGV